MSENDNPEIGKEARIYVTPENVHAIEEAKKYLARRGFIEQAMPGAYTTGPRFMEWARRGAERAEKRALANVDPEIVLLAATMEEMKEEERIEDRELFEAVILIIAAFFNVDLNKFEEESTSSPMYM